MSVTTCKFLDRIHFHFSHHVEHHLFPAMCSSMTPHVREVSSATGDCYLAPPHWWALVTAFQTPQIYDGPQVLVEPYSGRRKQIPLVEATLRAYQNADIELSKLAVRALQVSPLDDLASPTSRYRRSTRAPVFQCLQSSGLTSGGGSVALLLLSLGDTPTPTEHINIIYRTATSNSGFSNRVRLAAALKRGMRRQGKRLTVPLKTGH